MNSESKVRFVKLLTPGMFDYLRDLLRREPVCFPCGDGRLRPEPHGSWARDAAAGWSGRAEWYSDMGPGRNVALLCGSHKAEYEANLLRHSLPYEEEGEAYIFEHSGPFLLNPRPVTLGRGR